MRVFEVMSPDVEFIAPEEDAREAAVLMGGLDVGALPVGTASEIEGVITERDILDRAIAAGLDPNAAMVGRILSRPVVACSEADARAGGDGPDGGASCPPHTGARRRRLGDGVERGAPWSSALFAWWIRQHSVRVTGAARTGLRWASGGDRT